jgi:hypothetical protein
MPKLKHLETTSPSVVAKSKLADPVPEVAPRRGPMVGSEEAVASIRLAEWMAKAPPEEVAELKRKIEARLGNVETFWCQCDSKTGCANTFKLKAADIDSPCLKCNLPGRATGAKMRRMTPEHVRKYLTWVSNQKVRAQEARDRIDYEAEQSQRRRCGMEPYQHIGDWRADRREAWQKKLGQEAKVAAGWATK